MFREKVSRALYSKKPFSGQPRKRWPVAAPLCQPQEVLPRGGRGAACGPPTRLFSSPASWWPQGPPQAPAKWSFSFCSFPLCKPLGFLPCSLPERTLHLFTWRAEEAALGYVRTECCPLGAAPHAPPPDPPLPGSSPGPKPQARLAPASACPAPRPSSPRAPSCAPHAPPPCQLPPPPHSRQGVRGRRRAGSGSLPEGVRSPRVKSQGGGLAPRLSCSSGEKCPGFGDELPEGVLGAGTRLHV